MRLLLCCLILLPTGLTVHGQPAGTEMPTAPVQLKLQWRVGQQSRYQLTSRTEMRMQPAGQPAHQISQILSGTLICRVERANDDGGGRLAVRMANLKMQLNIDGKTTELTAASADAEHPDIRQMLKTLQDQRFLVDIQPNGAIDRIDGLEQAAETLSENSADSLAGRNLIRNLIHAVCPIPNAPARITPDSQWQSQQLEAMEPGTVKTVHQYRLLGTETIAGIRVATIQSTAQIQFEPKTPELPPGMALEIDLTEAEGKGFSIYDFSRHEIVGRFQHSRIVMAIQVTGHGLNENGQAVIQSTMRLLRSSEQ